MTDSNTRAPSPQHKTPRRLRQIVNAEATTDVSEASAAIPDLTHDPEYAHLDLAPGEVPLLYFKPRIKNRGENVYATFYRDGRVRFSPAVSRWLQNVGWKNANFKFPHDHTPGTVSESIWLRGFPQYQAPVITFRDDGFAEVWIDRMSDDLKRHWPSGQWSTQVQTTDDETPGQIANLDLVICPVHPSVKRRTSSRRHEVFPPEFKRARRPVPGDIYESKTGRRRMILDVVKANRDDLATVTYVENGVTKTTKLSYFREWIYGGGRLVEESLL